MKYLLSSHKRQWANPFYVFLPGLQNEYVRETASRKEHTVAMQSE